jgi:hypothetical protein
MDMLQLRDVLLKREDGNPYLSPRGMQGLVVSVVFTSLAATFVGIRLYTRLKFLRRLEANDWMVVIALVGYLCGSRESHRSQELTIRIDQFIHLHGPGYRRGYKWHGDASQRYPTKHP